MIRISEMVLPGHPDKFCDQVADAIVAECVKQNEGAYVQVEVSVWSDRVWLSGGLCTTSPLARSLADIVTETGIAIGYTSDNHIDASRYVVENQVCQVVDDPRQWTTRVNDQSVVIGWAGYDEKTHFLPPEHFLCHCFREALTNSCMSGSLKGQGPDGKLMVRFREEEDRWTLEHILVTIQQRNIVDFMAVCQATESVLQSTYMAAQKSDQRWKASWEDVSLLINPNGPMVEAGSDGDNGQTGRKLAMDFYGPRVPIGGGALSGKHLSHIDRIGAYAARHAAIKAVSSGARECLVRLAYAPNQMEPLDVTYEMEGRGVRQQPEFFSHPAMGSRYSAKLINFRLGQGLHFFDLDQPWNNELKEN